jgi:isoleucyl-tRNA synthetase
MFKPVDTRFDVPALEHEVIRFWEENDIEAKYLRRNQHSEQRWSFIDGPITANGEMGVHHAWGRTYKDLWQRYHTMLGHKQRYQNGFDCQGLWVEVTVERELGFKSKRDIEQYGIAEFVRKCKASVFHFAAIQTSQTKRLGNFMDWENSYFTLSDENNYSVWRFLKTCHENGWLYKGKDVMPWCVRCGTGLSEQEVATTDYEELVHTSVYVKFPLLDRENESLLVWTTTPWTLTSNVAAAVNPGNDPQTGQPVVYVKVRRNGEIFFAARDALQSISPGFEIIEELRGSDMVGWRYRGPFDELPAASSIEHRVIPWTEVSATEGTGIVHIAPGAGKEDFALSKELGLPAMAPLDEAGKYVEGFAWLTGKDVHEVANDIVDDLRSKGILFRAHEYSHRYPMCWRCRTPLVFRLVDEWFIALDDLRERMMQITETIHWLPSFGRERELDWLRNMGDWMISKKRYWGLALPIFECACGRVEVLGGKQELFERAVSGLDGLESPHRPWIDAVHITCPDCGERVSRIRDVGNPWLDAGIVPFSTLHYNDDPDQWRQWFPADFITESFPGQFRNWFYSMIAQAAALENTKPFDTVLGYGLLRDVNGREMHKSWGNLIPFDEAADGVGADLMRWLFLAHTPENNLNFGYSLLDAVKARLLTLWNTYSFFVTYANIDGFDPSVSAIPVSERTLLDRWIVACLNVVILDVRQGLERYDAASAVEAMDGFIDDLSTWYVRRSRRRFWKSGRPDDDMEKRAAYVTLYECLRTLSLLMAPFVPHVAEDLYQNLVGSASVGWPESVHLCDFPEVSSSLIDSDLVDDMESARRLVSLGRAAREQAQLKVRQPLGLMYATLPQGGSMNSEGELRELILDELNVKRLEPAPAGAEFVDYRIRPNLPLLGKKYGREVQQIKTALAELPAAQVAASVHAGQSVEVRSNGRTWTLAPEEILVEAVRKEGFTAAAEEGYLVALDTQITPELKYEGLARELARAVNELRKERKLNLEDRITITHSAETEGFKLALKGFEDYIARETLAQTITSANVIDSDSASRLESDGEIIVLSIAKV